MANRFPRAGQKVLKLQGAMPRETGLNQTLCADMQGFSPHAAVLRSADDRQALQQRCRYIIRTALANEPAQCNTARQRIMPTAGRTNRAVRPMSALEFPITNDSSAPPNSHWRTSTICPMGEVNEPFGMPRWN